MKGSRFIWNNSFGEIAGYKRRVKMSLRRTISKKGLCFVLFAIMLMPAHDKSIPKKVYFCKKHFVVKSEGSIIKWIIRIG